MLAAWLAAKLAGLVINALLNGTVAMLALTVW
jgi:hypothetical protein